MHLKGTFIKTQANAGYIEIIEKNLFDKETIDPLFKKADICINLVVKESSTEYTTEGLRMVTFGNNFFTDNSPSILLKAYLESLISSRPKDDK